MVDFPDEILYGRAGYIYALLYVIKHVGRVIPVEEVRKVSYEIYFLLPLSFLADKRKY